MIYVEAPKYRLTGKPRTIFLAGGITNCPDWQSAMVESLNHKHCMSDVIVFNPRRENFPIHDPEAANEQIKWEHHYLYGVDAVVFWFARGSLNPIVLFEYGKELGRRDGKHPKQWKKLFVGCDPEYERVDDVVIQTRLHEKQMGVEPMPISNSLDGVIDRIVDWCQE